MPAVGVGVSPVMSGSVSTLTTLERLLALSPSVLLRADVGITLNGSDVSAWANQGSLGGSFSQGTASAQPAFNASAKNGQPGVGPFTSGQILTSTLGLSHPFSLFVVYSATADGSAQRAIGADGSNFFIGCASNRHRVFSGAYATPDVALSTGVFVHSGVTQNAGDVDTYIDGAATGTGTTTTEVPTNIAIGSSTGSGQYIRGTILQVAGFSRILSTADIATLTSITATHFDF